MRDAHHEEDAERAEVGAIFQICVRSRLVHEASRVLLVFFGLFG